MASALICVDVQNDFLPGGALAVPDGDQVILPLADAAREVDFVVATADWHPLDHCSFTEQGGKWPVHCVAGTHGAQVEQRIYGLLADTLVLKGTENDHEAYSGFRAEDTDLKQLLLDRGVTEVWVGGLATEYCVKATVMDALAAGFDTTVLAHACRGIDNAASLKALAMMVAVGAKVRW